MTQEVGCASDRNMPGWTEATMILGNLTQRRRYAAISPGFKKGFELLLKVPDLTPKGRNEVEIPGRGHREIQESRSGRRVAAERMLELRTTTAARMADSPSERAQLFSILARTLFAGPPATDWAVDASSLAGSAIIRTAGARLGRPGGVACIVAA